MVWRIWNQVSFFFAWAHSTREIRSAARLFCQSWSAIVAELRGVDLPPSTSSMLGYCAADLNPRAPLSKPFSGFAGAGQQ